MLISFSPEFSKHIACSMLSSAGHLLNKQLEKSALKELVNQVSAKIVNKLDDEGFDWDIGPLSLVVNGDPHVALVDMESLIPYEYREGSMAVTVALREKEEGGF